MLGGESFKGSHNASDSVPALHHKPIPHPSWHFIRARRNAGPLSTFPLTFPSHRCRQTGLESPHWLELKQSLFTWSYPVWLTDIRESKTIA